jgi:hypothetical protein
VKELDDQEARRFDDAYVAALGRPAAVFHVKPERQIPGTPHIDVHIWRGPTFALLVTAGMSSRAQPDPGAHRPRVELYAKVPASLSSGDLVSTCEMLWAVAQWPFRNNECAALAEWHMVHGMPFFSERSKLNAFLVTMPLSPDQPVAKMIEAVGAELLHAYGMTDGERAEAERLGIERRIEFSRALMHTAGSLTDPNRREVGPRAIREALALARRAAKGRAAKVRGGAGEA